MTPNERDLIEAARKLIRLLEGFQYIHKLSPRETSQMQYARAVIARIEDGGKGNRHDHT